MNQYKNREQFSQIKKLLKIPEIIVIHGARQVGKTTLMKMVAEHIECGKLGEVFYLDLEKEDFLNLCNSGVEEVIRYIKARQKDKNKKVFLFIDEVQYLDNPTGLLKLFYDHYKNDFKLIVSGSSTFAIKLKFKDSLVGRIIDLELFGLSFKEFLNFKNLSYDLSSDSPLVSEELKKVFLEYAAYGFYPQVVLADTIELKEMYLKGIIEKYIYKDVKDLANIRGVGKFNNLLKVLSSSAGQLVNASELSNTLNISRPTIEDYLFIFDNTYIIKLIYPFYKNIRSELTKMPKIYFEDTGILNFLKNKKLNEKIDGSQFENSIFCYLRRKIKADNIRFWRTVSGQEVDFVVSNGKLISLEAKLTYTDKSIKSVISLGKKYKIDKAYCVVMKKLDKSKNKDIIQIYPWEIETIY